MESAVLEREDSPEPGQWAQALVARLRSEPAQWLDRALRQLLRQQQEYLEMRDQRADTAARSVREHDWKRL